MMPQRVVSAEYLPIWLHNTVFAVAGVLLLWFGWNAYNAYRTTTVIIEKIVDMERLQATLLYLDEVLTMSARMAAATGEAQWEARYRQYEPQLDAALQQALYLAPMDPAADDAIAAAVAQMAGASRTMTEMEKRGLALVHQGDPEAARALLMSAEYAEQQRLYTAGRAQFTALLVAAGQTFVQTQARRTWRTMMLAAVTLALALLGWRLILPAMRRWIADAHSARGQASQAECALREAYAGLKHRLHERTAELERVNHYLHREIAERQRTEAALRESEARRHATVASALDCVITLDQDGCILEFNPAAEQTFGYTHTEAIGRQLDALLIPPGLRERHNHGLAQYLMPGASSTPQQRFETTARRADGMELAVEVSVVRLGGAGPAVITGFVRDTTERRRLEAQLRQAQKMEAIGTLAGGIAHDFNNILAVILGYTELALDDVAPASVAGAHLGQVLIATQRAKELVQHILTFSRQSAQEQTPVQPGGIIEEALSLLRGSLPSTIEVHKHLTRDVGYILADATQIHRVVMNLCTNAAHAMRDTGGVLELRLDAIDIGAEHGGYPQSLRPGVYARLTVRDTGHGMAPEVMERIFEPFFTTKHPGEGTGLGLAVVHGIVVNHHGAITVDSQLGHGTTFTVYLPCLVEAAAEHTQARDHVPRGSERILLVDDEAAVAVAGQATLMRLGYDVQVYTSATAALAAFQTAPQRFDVVITNQTMPQMTGEKLAEALRRIRPDIPIILCTGFSHTLMEHNALARGIAAVCMKPLTGAELALTIRRVLAHCTP